MGVSSKGLLGDAKIRDYFQQTKGRTKPWIGRNRDGEQK